MTETTEARWEYINGSGATPYGRNRGYVTRGYRLIGPKTREEALAAVQKRREDAWPVETFSLRGQNDDGTWNVAYSIDSTD